MYSVDRTTTGFIKNVKAPQKSRSKIVTQRAYNAYAEKTGLVAENSNNSNQDKIVKELREKLRLSQMKQKEMKATLTELKKLMK